MGQRDCARLVVFPKRRIGFGIAIDQRLERTTVWTALAHVNFVVAQNHLSVDHPAALGTNAAGQFVKDVVGISFLGGCGTCHRVGIGDLLRAHRDSDPSDLANDFGQPSNDSA